MKTKKSKYLNTREAAELLDVSVQTIRRMRAARLLSVLEIPGHHPRFSREAIEQMIDRRTTKERGAR
jgi:excisionase family DNA binding protein